MLAEGWQTVVRPCVKPWRRKDLRSPVLSLRTFGGIELTRGETPILPRRRKELVLLAFLARRSPRGVTRAVLAALLWGHRDESRARHSLRQSLSELKAELGDSLEITPETVRLRAGAVELDLRAFELAVESGREDEAAKLWRRAFLAGVGGLGGGVPRAWHG